MISRNETVLKDTINLSVLNIVFTSKPIVVGGLAMEYYGLRGYVEN